MRKYVIATILLCFSMLAIPSQAEAATWNAGTWYCNTDYPRTTGHDCGSSDRQKLAALSRVDGFWRIECGNCGADQDIFVARVHKYHEAGCYYSLVRYEYRYRPVAHQNYGAPLFQFIRKVTEANCLENDDPQHRVGPCGDEGRGGSRD